MIIEEHKGHHQSTFDIVTRDSNGRKTVVRTIYALYAETKNREGKTRRIIYDELMRPIGAIYRYLNTQFKGRSSNTLQGVVTALRLLVVFCEAHNLKEFKIPEIYCEDFVDFLYRNDRTQASSASGYFQHVKAFLKYLKRHDDPIMDHSSKIRWADGADGLQRPVTYDDYKYAPKRNPNRHKVCPPHNTLGDFIRLLDVIKSHNDTAGIIIVVLEFVMGRRIGELQGLSIEDVGSKVNTETGEQSHCLFFRNRLSDNKSGQSAKNREHPTSAARYSHPDYIREYESHRNCIRIENEIYDLLKAYILKVHREAAEKYPAKYAKAKADIVNPKQFKSDWNMEENHYLFLDSLGGRLSKAAWNKRLRRYYMEAGIPLGFGKSINHSWRHTIAVIMMQELKMTETQIADFLGHKGTGSVCIYTMPSYDKLGELNHRVYQYITNQIDSFEDNEDGAA